MKRIAFLAMIALLCQAAQGQSDSALLKEINEQVWKPFIKSFNTNDDAGFQQVHSKEVTRVIQDASDIYGYDIYFRPLPDSIKAKRNQWKKNIELRFTGRIAAGDRAFETGYYKTTSTNSQTGEVHTGIGRFHVLLRKEKGVWKILMDADTSEGATEESFLKAKPL